MGEPDGIALLTCGARLAKRNRGQTLPRWGEKWIAILKAGVIYRLMWRPRVGYRVSSFRGALESLPEAQDYDVEGHRRDTVKKRASAPGPMLRPLLPADTKVLKPFPLLVEFLTCITYEDAQPREPGYMRIRPGLHDFEGTLYDPDAGQRCSIRGKTLDDVFAALNLLAGAPEAPWETDQYLTDQLAKKTRKKK